MFRRVASLMVVVLVLPGVWGVGRSAAQDVGVGAAGFQTIIVDPYSQALGGATVALRGYPGAASINPAAIGRPQTIQLGSNWNTSEGGFFQTPWLPDAFTDTWLTSPSIDVRLRRWAFAYQFKQFTWGDIAFRDAQNNLLDRADLKDRSHKVVVAYDLRPNLTMGLGVNLILSDLSGMEVGAEQDLGGETTVSFDLGLVYDLEFDVPFGRLKPSLGWSLTDFGRPIRYAGDSRAVAPRESPLTMVMRGGLSLQAELDEQWLRRPVVTLGLHGGLSKYLVGVDDDFESYGPFEALVKTWKPIEVRTNALNAEPAEFKKVGVLDQLITHAGLEASLLRIVFLRWGDFDEPGYVGGRQYATFGFGIDLYYVALDYSKAGSSDSRSPFDGMTFWRLTARIPLASSPDNFWPGLFRELRRF